MNAILPGATIGILGGGQLGRMLASAAHQLGFDTVILCPETDAPAARVAKAHIQADYTDRAALNRLAEVSDVITLEFENIPVEAAEFLAKTATPLHPGARSLAMSQDRSEEKAFLGRIGIETAPYHIVRSEGEIHSALTALGGIGLLKTCRDGYDGKGQVWIRSLDDVSSGFAAVGEVPCVLEGPIDFDCEISVIVARSSSGETTTWAPPRNHHEDGILSTSTVPSGLEKSVEQAARDKAMHLINELGHVGVLALEFFVMADGKLIANEFAPRVHNSGHWTPEGCQTGQFEQHIRAICGWPLGDTRRLHDVEMRNLLGNDGLISPSDLKPNETLTIYGKREARKGRKMGHITKRLGPRKD